MSKNKRKITKPYIKNLLPVHFRVKANWLELVGTPCKLSIFFLDTHACKELHKRSHKFALQNFQEVMNTEEFLLLPFSEVNTLN